MSPNPQQDSEVFVTFTNGLGAKIFSAAIYYYLKGKGRTAMQTWIISSSRGKQLPLETRVRSSHLLWFVIRIDYNKLSKQSGSNLVIFLQQIADLIERLSLK